MTSWASRYSHVTRHWGSNIPAEKTTLNHTRRWCRQHGAAMRSLRRWSASARTKWSSVATLIYAVGVIFPKICDSKPIRSHLELSYRCGENCPTYSVTFRSGPVEISSPISDPLFPWTRARIRTSSAFLSPSINAKRISRLFYLEALSAAREIVVIRVWRAACSENCSCASDSWCPRIPTGAEDMPPNRFVKLPISLVAVASSVNTSWATTCRLLSGLSWRLPTWMGGMHTNMASSSYLRSRRSVGLTVSPSSSKSSRSWGLASLAPASPNPALTTPCSDGRSHAPKHASYQANTVNSTADILIRWLPGTEQVQPDIRCRASMAALLVLITASKFFSSLLWAVDEAWELCFSGAPGDSSDRKREAAILAQLRSLAPASIESSPRVLLASWSPPSVLPTLPDEAPRGAMKSAPNSG